MHNTDNERTHLDDGNVHCSYVQLKRGSMINVYQQLLNKQNTDSFRQVYRADYHKMNLYYPLKLRKLVTNIIYMERVPDIHNRGKKNNHPCLCMGFTPFLLPHSPSACVCINHGQACACEPLIYQRKNLFSVIIFPAPFGFTCSHCVTSRSA